MGNWLYDLSIDITKHTKLFYRAIARIRALNVRDGGSVLIDRLMKVYKLGPIRAFNLAFELQKAGAIRAWDKSDFKKTPRGEKWVGNILWENMSKFRVPKEITKEETLRVKEELKSGKFPRTIEEWRQKKINNFDNGNYGEEKKSFNEHII